MQNRMQRQMEQRMRDAQNRARNFGMPGPP
jgi:hypothetical protein